jgi:hypothetical protein
VGAEQWWYGGPKKMTSSAADSVTDLVSAASSGHCGSYFIPVTGVLTGPWAKLKHLWCGASANTGAAAGTNVHGCLTIVMIRVLRLWSPAQVAWVYKGFVALIPGMQRWRTCKFVWCYPVSGAPLPALLVPVCVTSDRLPAGRHVKSPAWFRPVHTPKLSVQLIGRADHRDSSLLWLLLCSASCPLSTLTKLEAHTMSETKPAASSGSLLFDVVAHHLDLPLQQLCTLSCASASTREMLRHSLQQRSVTYPVSFKVKDMDEIDSFTAWWVALASVVQGAATSLRARFFGRHSTPSPSSVTVLTASSA